MAAPRLRAGSVFSGCGDTESLLSASTVLRLRANPGRVSSLSDVLKPPGQACENSFPTRKMVLSLINKVSSHGKSLDVWIHAPQTDLVGVKVTFSIQDDSVCMTLESESDLPDCHLDGLRDFLAQLVQSSPATPSFDTKPAGSPKGS